ncbi:sulfatase-like hydrolase/transferase [Marinovum sp. 2_MG-2023]|uniref:sulfatase-like hydrolase/transferase n=1 Tax=unclassified Marinovum TaxID=2647166 RepID=UPI0026E48AFF|nr:MULTISPECIES: sulfatase-like hydrolase/transferase [unclassified Marinovum]MDO6732807.1 sulfatase-like hydrolase/transferase [Marinovum sp. 2_MG-2023]MDO6782076.1 sulfatase-like hydrolase/transferase [Marinovum sp. 1_MG-2023]
MTPQNTLLIMSDQHSPKALGCYGNAIVKTPNLDRLAEQGTSFSSAYCNSPICVPARAAIATGRYVHQTGYWDNSRGYDGSVPSWGHRLAHEGHSVESIGKLHFRSEADPTGFDRQHLPMHVAEGGGALLGLLRDDTAVLKKYRGYHEDAGPGDSPYTEYDRKIAARAAEWLLAKAKADEAKPWAAMVSFVCPHPPLQCPAEFYAMYPPEEMPLPYLLDPGARPEHPAMRTHRIFQGCDAPFSEDVVRRSVSAYFGLCSFLDHNVGLVLDALEASGMAENTRVIYTSDHGEANGNQGLWGKYNMYEDSVGVPMIMAGHGIARGQVVDTPVTHVDLYQTILESVGAPGYPQDDAEMPGKSLFQVAAHPDPERVAFSEYHAAAANTAVYMVRKGRYKFVYYVGLPNQLFDLETDPDERENLIESETHAAICAEYEAILRNILDPEAIDALARSDQSARIVANGGRDAIRQRGAFGATPVPGEKAVFVS